MPKNREKYRYFEVGLAHDSWVLTQLEKDAILHQMDDQPAKLIAMRLTEYYKLADMGIFAPGITERMQPMVAPSMNGHANGTKTAAALPPSPYTDLTEQDETPSAAPRSLEDEAADYWGTL